MTRALGYLIAAAFAGVFIVGVAYFTANMISMALLNQALDR